MDIYKDMVLEALEVEPLGFSTWAATNADTGACTYCAIGSVIINTHPTMVQDEVEDVGHHLGFHADGSCVPNESDRLPATWAQALSFVWESLGPHYIIGPASPEFIEEARWHMIDWVEASVPDDEVLFTIGATI